MSVREEINSIHKQNEVVVATSAMICKKGLLPTPERLSHRPGATLTHAAICSRGVYRAGSGASL